MVEFHPHHVDAVIAERMDVAVADPGPVAKLDAELVGRVGGADEIILVDVEQAVEQVDLRNRRLADADRADLLRFDELDGEGRDLADDPRQAGRRHPAGGAAADNHHLADGVGPQKTNSGSGGGDAGPWTAQVRAMNSPWVGSRSAVCR